MDKGNGIHADSKHGKPVGGDACDTAQSDLEPTYLTSTEQNNNDMVFEPHELFDLFSGTAAHFLDSVFDPFVFERELNTVNNGLFSSQMWGAVPLGYHNNVIVREPPYARLLRRLGLFDPIEIPPERKGHTHYGQSTFPVIAYSAKGYPKSGNGGSGGPFQDMHSSCRDGGGVEDGEDTSRRPTLRPLADAFKESTKWAIGNIFTHMRDAMDYIEDGIKNNEDGCDRSQLPQAEKREIAHDSNGTFYDALRKDMISNANFLFPDVNAKDRSQSAAGGSSSTQGMDYRSYSIRSRTLPDGTIETKRSIRHGDGTMEETVERYRASPGGAFELVHDSNDHSASVAESEK